MSFPAESAEAHSVSSESGLRRGTGVFYGSQREGNIAREHGFPTPVDLLS